MCLIKDYIGGSIVSAAAALTFVLVLGLIHTEKVENIKVTFLLYT